MKYTHLLQDDAPELYPPDDVAPLPIDGAVHAPKAETVAGGATAHLSLEAAEVQAGGVAAPLPLGSAAHALEALASAGSAVGGLKTKNHNKNLETIPEPRPMRIFARRFAFLGNRFHSVSHGPATVCWPEQIVEQQMF